jgi:hypothetical protein
MLLCPYTSSTDRLSHRDRTVEGRIAARTKYAGRTVIIELNMNVARASDSRPSVKILKLAADLRWNQSTDSCFLS